MSNAEKSAAVTGTITAVPNPVPSIDGARTVISWKTNDPKGAEVRVSTTCEEEKLFSRGQKGSVEVEWITGFADYNFDLYGSSQPESRLDRVTVHQTNGSFSTVLSQMMEKAKRGKVDLEELATFIARVAPSCVHSSHFPEFFRLWESSGIHITPVHFYQPIPDTRALPNTLWQAASDLPAVDMNDSLQLDFICHRFPQFRGEYENIPVTAQEPGQFSLTNGRFDGTDALVTYCMIRHHKPRTIIEVGSGYSSLISGQAAAKNGAPALVCLDPFPLDFLARGFPGLRTFIQEKAERMDLDFFSQLQSGDILFLDSSHTVKIGSDVNYLFLEVLPRLNPGVIVHVHDIFFPFEYPRDWAMDECRFWTEQYILQAFLAFNSEFEVLLCNSFLAHYHLEKLKATFPTSPSWGGGSFWMRRRLREGSRS